MGLARLRLQVVRSLLDEFLQVQAVVHQFLVAALDLREHAVEPLAERAELVAAVQADADAVIVPVRDGLRGGGEFLDRPGDQPPQQQGQEIGQHERDQQHAADDVDGFPDVRLQLVRPGLQKTVPISACPSKIRRDAVMYRSVIRSPSAAGAGGMNDGSPSAV